MNLSLAIPAYNNIVDTLQCLNSLQALAAERSSIEWLIQDDCSPDFDLRKLIPPYAAAVARNVCNVGFAANCNAGAARATGDILVFCNQDIIANGHSVSWDHNLTSLFLYDANIGIIGARLLFPDGKLQSAGGEFDAHLQPHHRCLGYSDLTHWEIATRQEVAWVTGAFLAIRRDVFQQVGGFDERYIGGYFEDVDLCLRVKEVGYTVWYDPDVTFTHKVGSAGGSPHFMHNALLFKQRWVDTNKIRADVPVILEKWW